MNVTRLSEQRSKRPMDAETMPGQYNIATLKKA